MTQEQKQLIREKFENAFPDPMEKEVRDMFVVKNIRFSGLANDKLTPEKLIDFIQHQLDLAIKQTEERIVDELEALRRKKHWDSRYSRENRCTADSGHCEWCDLMNERNITIDEIITLIRNK